VHLKYPLPIVMVVLALLSHGCPLAAIVFAFGIDERTVASWQMKAGDHAKRVQCQFVCRNTIQLAQVQVDEVWAKLQGQTAWIAAALCVFPRLFLWGAVSMRRDKHLLLKVMSKVRQSSGRVIQPILFSVDGFAAYPKMLKKLFAIKERQRRGRPKRIPWPKLNIVQVIKRYNGKRLSHIERRLAHGDWGTASRLLVQTQTQVGCANTAYIERFNATLRARLPSLVRRTRNLARTVKRLEMELFWSGVVYNFCTVHTTLQGTPTMAAGITKEVWSIRRLLLMRTPDIWDAELDHVFL
jgi:transposase-like protein